ncbi:MAG: hypothetical protein AAFW98_07405, partial [Pseudomonadota bacterium]
ITPEIPAVTVNICDVLTTINSLIGIVQDFVEGIILGALDAVGINIFAAIDSLKAKLLEPFEGLAEALARVETTIDEVIARLGDAVEAVEVFFTDLAEMLGTHGHVTALRRTRVASFGEDDMITLEALEALAADPQAAIDARLLPPAAALEGLDTVTVDKVAASRLRRGQASLVRPLELMEEAEIGAICGGELVALCRAQHGALHPVRVFRSPRRRITVNPKERPSPCDTSSSPPASPSAS